MIRSKNNLPPECRTVWNDFHLIEVFSKRLNPAERAKVDTVLDIQYPNKLQRAWTQFKTICDEKFTLYRLQNLQSVTATAAATINTPSGPYWFGCDQKYSGKDCALVQKIVQDNPEYKVVPSTYQIRWSHTATFERLRFDIWFW